MIGSYLSVFIFGGLVVGVATFFIGIPERRRLEKEHYELGYRAREREEQAS